MGAQDGATQGRGDPPDAARRRPPGIKDVAVAAGVSWKTVSNVVNGTGRVGAETRARVEAAIESLGYRPNIAGRQLRQGRTHILALAVPWITSPYFAALAHDVIVAAERRGYSVFIDETRSEPERERTVARGYDVRLIDGIVFSPLGLSLDEVDELRGSVPMVLLGERDAQVGRKRARTDHVGIDNVGAAREATRHLIDGGHTRIGFLGVEPGAPVRTSVPRLEGMRRELAAAGLPVDERWLLPVPEFTRASGATAVEAVLPRIGEIDALLCANDDLALGALHALRSNGVRVPEDVALVGWDNIEDGRWAHPPLTTVAPDREAVAQTAVDRLIAQVDGRDDGPGDLIVAHRLLARASSGGLP